MRSTGGCIALAKIKGCPRFEFQLRTADMVVNLVNIEQRFGGAHHALSISVGLMRGHPLMTFF